MSSTREAIKHLDYIDAVRGFAFLWVLTLHCAICVGAFPLQWIFLHGVFGVQLFFLASAVTLRASWAQRSSVDRFPALSFCGYEQFPFSCGSVWSRPGSHPRRHQA